MTSKYQKLLDKKRALQEELTQLGKEALDSEFREFLTANPQVHAIQWTQYTPYFNDGETCEFSVNDMHVDLGDGEYLDSGDLSRDEEWYEDGMEPCTDWMGKPSKRTKYSKRAIEPIDAALGDALDGFARVVDENIFLTVFGDHAEVTYTLEGGFQVEEYSHD